MRKDHIILALLAGWLIAAASTVQVGDIITIGGYAQSSLPASSNGSIVYCSDCNQDDTCTGGGTGAVAHRLNGSWDCSSGGGGGDLGDDEKRQWGAGNDYWIVYNSTGTVWEFWSTDVDGGGTDGILFQIQDGTDDIQSTNANGWQINGGASTATAPTMLPNGINDPDTGIGDDGADVMSFTVGGIQALEIYESGGTQGNMILQGTASGGTFDGSQGNSFSIDNTPCNNNTGIGTAPYATIQPNKGDGDTGLACGNISSADELWILAGGESSLKITEGDFASGETIMYADPCTFANLGAATNGAFCYCSDCDLNGTVGACASTPGTGSWAFRLNGAWQCL